MPRTHGDGSDREPASLRPRDELLPDPLLVALGYLTAFEGGPLRADRDFIVGYLMGLRDSKDQDIDSHGESVERRSSGSGVKGEST